MFFISSFLCLPLFSSSSFFPSRKLDDGVFVCASVCLWERWIRIIISQSKSILVNNHFSYFHVRFEFGHLLFTFQLHLYWASVFTFVPDRKRVFISFTAYTVKRQWPVNSWIDDDNDDDNDSNDNYDDNDGIGGWRNLFLWYQQTKPANSKLINQIIHTHTHLLARSLTKLMFFLLLR